jgi:hypothetical protein
MHSVNLHELAYFVLKSPASDTDVTVKVLDEEHFQRCKIGQGSSNSHANVANHRCSPSGFAVESVPGFTDMSTAMQRNDAIGVFAVSAETSLLTTVGTLRNFASTDFDLKKQATPVD